MRTRGRAPRRYAPSWLWRTPANTGRPRAESGFLQRVVPGQDVRIRLSEMIREFFGDVDRTVLAAGATDRNGEIAAIRLRELADTPLQELDQIRDHAAHAG